MACMNELKNFKTPSAAALPVVVENQLSPAEKPIRSGTTLVLPSQFLSAADL